MKKSLLLPSFAHVRVLHKTRRNSGRGFPAWFNADPRFRCFVLWPVYKRVGCVSLNP